MIESKEALDIVLQNTLNFGIESVEIENCVGRVLAEAIYADRAIPPFDRVCMDGIAIKYDSFTDGHRTFSVESIGAAGDEQKTLKDPLKCVEIMTGAPLPKNTDTIIRYEDLKATEGAYKILIDLKPYINIHYKGRDHDVESVLLEEKMIIKAIDVNILASVGKSKIKVFKLPKIAVISSGEELVPINKKPLDHQIRRSNVHMIRARLTEMGIPSSEYHFQDDSIDIVNRVKSIVSKYDVFLISGGVSMGKYDFIPSVLEEMKFQKLFHKVKQRPGKPFWFGRRPKKMIFAFPGNPVSTLACFHKYFIPWVNKSMHKNTQHILKVILGEDVTFKPNLTYFAQAKMRFEDNATITAFVKHGNGSGDLVNPTSMDGFIELPVGKDLYKKGDVFDFIPFRSVVN